MDAGERGPRGESGTAAVEFAVLLPVFVALLLGIIDYGWLYFNQLALANAAREGAREGVTHAPGDAQGGPEAAMERVSQYLDDSGIACGAGCDVTAADLGESPDRLLEVSVAFDYTPLVGFVPVPDQLQARSVMRYEVQF